MKKGKLSFLLFLMASLLTCAGCDSPIRGENVRKESDAAVLVQEQVEEPVIRITYRVIGTDNPSADDMADTVSKLCKRAEIYSQEAVVYQNDENEIFVEIPGEFALDEVAQELGKSGQLCFVAETDVDGNANFSMQSVTDENGLAEYKFMLHSTIEALQENGSIVLEGTDIKDACAVISQDSLHNSVSAVDLTMTEEGTLKFEDATRNAYEKGESIAIVCDGVVVSAPRVSGVIGDGKAVITSLDSMEEAQELAALIRIGELRLELEVIRSEVVGGR